jgi:hypothetical protein
MARVESEELQRGGLPRLSWGPIIAGVLLALAAHVVMGLIGGALGFAAQPADSRGLAAAAGFWGLLTPLVATALGAWLACRLAARQDEAGTNLHGVMVWCIGLVAGALFLAGTATSGALALGTAASGNGGVLERMAGRTQAGDLSDEAARRAAAAAGGGAMGALCGLIGAFAGAALARSRREGRGHGLGWRISLQRTDRPQPEGRPAPLQSERRYGEEVRDVARDEGPGAPPTEPPAYPH